MAEVKLEMRCRLSVQGKTEGQKERVFDQVEIPV